LRLGVEYWIVAMLEFAWVEQGQEESLLGVLVLALLLTLPLDAALYLLVIQHLYSRARRRGQH